MADTLFRTVGSSKYLLQVFKPGLANKEKPFRFWGEKCCKWRFPPLTSKCQGPVSVTISKPCTFFPSFRKHLDIWSMPRSGYWFLEAAAFFFFFGLVSCSSKLMLAPFHSCARLLWFITFSQKWFLPFASFWSVVGPWHSLMLRHHWPQCPQSSSEKRISSEMFWYLPTSDLPLIHNSHSLERPRREQNTFQPSTETSSTAWMDREPV